VAAAGQGRSVWLAKCKVLLVSSSVIQVSLPWMAAPRNAKRDETAGGWSEEHGAHVRRRRAGKARMSRSGGAKGRPQLCATAAPAGCGVLLDVACTCGHGGLLCSISVLLGAVCPSAHDAGRLPSVCTASPLGHVLPGYWLSFVPLLWYTGARMACLIPTRSSGRRRGIGRVGDDL
jgi:hypothetical protein